MLDAPKKKLLWLTQRLAHTEGKADGNLMGLGDDKDGIRFHTEAAWSRRGSSFRLFSVQPIASACRSDGRGERGRRLLRRQRNVQPRRRL